MSGHTPGQNGLFTSPASLASAAGGACAALCALWAMRGLPLGGLLLWLTPLPIMMAGLAFGARTAVYALGTASLAVVLLAPFLGFAIFLAAFGIPAALLAALATQGGRMNLSLPLAALGLWPLAVLLLLALQVPDLEAGLRAAVEMGIRRMGVSVPDAMVGQVARVKAAAAAFWLALVLIANGVVAQRWLEKRGLALLPSAPLDGLRLPDWYLPLPALALGAWLALGGAVALSAVLILLLPLFFLGVAAVHQRMRGRPARLAFLLGFYLLMLLFLQLMAPLMVGLGLYEQIRRRAAPPQT